MASEIKTGKVITTSLVASKNRIPSTTFHEEGVFSYFSRPFGGDMLKCNLILRMKGLGLPGSSAGGGREMALPVRCREVLKVAVCHWGLDLVRFPLSCHVTTQDSLPRPLPPPPPFLP